MHQPDNVLVTVQLLEVTRTRFNSFHLVLADHRAALKHRLEKDDLAEGALSIRGILKGIEAFLQCKDPGLGERKRHRMAEIKAGLPVSFSFTFQTFRALICDML